MQSSSRIKSFTKKYALYHDKIMVKKEENENSLKTLQSNVDETASQKGLTKGKKLSRGVSLCKIPNDTSQSA